MNSTIKHTKKTVEVKIGRRSIAFSSYLFKFRGNRGEGELGGVGEELGRSGS